MAEPGGVNPWQTGELTLEQPRQSDRFHGSLLFSCLVVFSAVGVVWMSLLLVALVIAFLNSADALSGCLAVLRPVWLLLILISSMFPGVILGTWLNERRQLSWQTLQEVEHRKEQLQREIAGRRTVRTAAAVQEQFSHERS